MRTERRTTYTDTFEVMVEAASEEARFEAIDITDMGLRMLLASALEAASLLDNPTYQPMESGVTAASTEQSDQGRR